MIIVLDSNILISALINPKGKEFKILTGKIPSIEFITPSYLVQEVNSKLEKIAVFTFNTEEEISLQFQLLLSEVSILNEKKLTNKIINVAKKIVAGIDLKDTLFIAVTIYEEGLLWTGDIKLLRSLRRKGFNQIISTKELQQIIKGL